MKTKVLLAALSIMVSSAAFCQIEELSAIPSKSSSQPNQKYFLKPFDNPLSLIEKMYDLRGKNIYCSENKNIIALSVENNVVRFERIRKGDVFEVVDAWNYKTKPFKDNFSSCKFVSDTFQYVNYKGNVQTAKIKKEDFDEILQSSIYHYYIAKKGNKMYYFVYKKDDFIWIPGMLGSYQYTYANMYDFISIDTYNYYKSKYEGKEYVLDNYIDGSKCEFTMKDVKNTSRYKINKVAIFNGKIAALMIDDRGNEQNVSFEEGYSSKIIFNLCHKNDSVERFCVSDSLRMMYSLVSQSDCDAVISKWEKEALEKQRSNEVAKQKRYADCVEKYGEEMAKAIIEGDIILGMTKEMCLESVGSPCDKQTRTNAMGEYEIWTYNCFYARNGYGNYVYVHFINGKVSQIDN